MCTYEDQKYTFEEVGLLVKNGLGKYEIAIPTNSPNTIRDGDYKHYQLEEFIQERNCCDCCEEPELIARVDIIEE